jgi:hypothetical protein
MDKNRLFIYLNPCIMFSMATDLPEENRMKALTLLDEMSQFHWSMLKSVLLILSMLPFAQGVLSVWQSTEGSSQIVVGFFAISLFSTWAVLSFWSALKVTVLTLDQVQITALEQKVVMLYRYTPMLFLAGMVSYLVGQI